MNERKAPSSDRVEWELCVLGTTIGKKQLRIYQVKGQTMEGPSLNRSDFTQQSDNSHQRFREFKILQLCRNPDCQPLCYSNKECTQHYAVLKINYSSLMIN